MFDEADWLALPEALRAEFPWPPQRLALDSGSLAHVEAGAGQPVLMLHRNQTWSFLYRHLIGSLCSDFRCLTPDYAGFGRSKAPAGFEFTPLIGSTNPRSPRCGAAACCADCAEYASTPRPTA